MSVNKFRSSKKFHVTGGTQRLTRVVGVALAKELVFTSRILDGNEAARMGVVNHSVEQNDAGDAAYHRAIELAKEITPNVSRGCCCHDRVVVKSPKQSLGDLLFLLRFLLLFLLLLFLFLFFLSAKHELVHGRSEELQDRIS